MPSLDPLRKRLDLPHRGERGMALPIALFAMIASIGLASAAVMVTVDVQQGSHRDGDTKQAIAVADAGANVARLRLARYATTLATSQCLVKNKATGLLEGAATTGSWCPAVTGTVAGGSYSYWASPAGSTCGEYKLCVVATGTAGGVTRRIEIAYSESAVLEETKKSTEGESSSGETKSGTTGSSGSSGFEGLIGQDSIELQGNADIKVGIGTNGSVTGVGNATVCGDIRHGVGKKWTTSGNAHQCSGYKVTEGNKTLPPVSSFMPSNIATSNSNYRLVKCTKTKPTPEPTGCELDTYTGSRSSTKPWNSTTRSLSVSSNDTLTVSGGDYWICSLSVSGNAQLIMSASAQVRFFFDTPEHCGLAAGSSQISLTGNARIASTNKSVLPAFYLLGSTAMETKVSLGGNASTTDEFVVYGPNTTIEIPGNATYKGVIAGKKAIVTGNGKIEDDSNYKPPAEILPTIEKTEPTEGSKSGGSTSSSTTTIARYYSPQLYVECSGPLTAKLEPNANC